MATREKKTGSCADCGREKVLEARGLCCGCYGRWKRNRKKPDALAGRTERAAPEPRACQSCERVRHLVARGLCSTCYARERRQRIAAVAAAPAAPASTRASGSTRPRRQRAAAPAAVAAPAPASAHASGSVALDFSDAPELRRDLEAQAKQEFRSLEMQILWKLKGPV
jgi:hypothetical protein